jgi:hypothetical protein
MSDMASKFTYLGLTKNNKKVYVDLKSSHAATHFADDPELINYVREILPDMKASGDNVFLQVDLGKSTGFSDLVETDDSDQIVYAKRLNRRNYTRFVLNREKVETSLVTIVLHKLGEDYSLYSAWVGPLTPPFPGSSHEAPDSREFWNKHALVWGKQQIQLGTETKEWPWG